jgi:hypothetical protein
MSSICRICSARGNGYEKKDKADGGRENTMTKKLGCSAQLVLKRKVELVGDEARYSGPWVLSKMNNQHNHILARSAAEMKASAYNPEMRQIVKEQCKAGARFHVIRNLLQSLSDNVITEGQVKGYISQWKSEYMDGRGDLQTMRDQLRDQASTSGYG